MSYLLSIIVPTRNNQKYLKASVLQILDNTKDNVQILIQDNSDTNELELFFYELKNKRVKYNYISERKSIVDNFALGISLADGKYIMSLGDDDGVLANINEYILYADENDVDALIPSLTFEYFWPNSVTVNGKKNGVVRFLKNKVSMVQVDGKNEVIKLLKNGCLDYYTFKLAKFYHGIVKKDILEKIYKKTGSYIGGLVPDIYTAVAISLTAKSIYYLNEPLTIAGVCPSSGSSQASNGLHTGKYEDTPQLIGRTVEYFWSEQVPKFYSVDTIWADSALAAVKDLGYCDLFKYYSIENLIGRLKYRYTEFGDLINECYVNNKKNMSKISLLKSDARIKFYLMIDLFNKIKRRIKRINKKLTFYDGIRDINEASKIY